MRLHKITLLNLNSLYGEQCLDLDKDLAGASLFLIHGRTGSGKSTLMDAVALALFGKTPRLDDRRNSPDSDPCGIMSRGTGQCRATVEFSRMGSDGRRIRFEAEWKARRSRNRSDGKLQPVERSLRRMQEDGSWELLVSEKKKSLVEPVFREALEDFSVEDFQRSMLLAQGRFDELLNATPQERATILERLTDTSEYRKLGENAARLASAYRRNLEYLKRHLEGTEPATESQAEAAKDAAESSTKRWQACSVDLDRDRQHLEWWRQLLSLRERLQALQEEQQELRLARKAAEPELKKLQDHEASSSIFEAMDHLERLKNRRGQCQEEQEHKTKQRDDAKLALKAKSALSIAAQESLERINRLVVKLRIPCASLETELHEKEGKSQALLPLEQRLTESEESVKGATAGDRKAGVLLLKAKEGEEEAQITLSACAKHLSLRNAWNKDLRELLQRLLGAEERYAEEQEAQNSRAEEICSRSAHWDAEEQGFLLAMKSQRAEPLAKVELLRGRLKALCEDDDPSIRRRFLNQSVELAQPLVINTLLAQKGLADEAERSRELAAAEVHQGECSKKEAACCAAHTGFQKSAASAFRRMEDAEKHWARLKLVGEIATRRAALRKGEDCPLCGSIEHPYLQDPASCPDQRALLQTWEDAQSELNARRTESKGATAEHRESEGLWIAARSEQKNAVVLRESLARKLEERAQGLKTLRRKAQLAETCELGECERLLQERTTKLEESQASHKALVNAMQQLEESEEALRVVQEKLSLREAERQSERLRLREQEKYLKERQERLLRERKEAGRCRVELKTSLEGWGLNLSSQGEPSELSVTPVVELRDWQARSLAFIATAEKAETGLAEARSRRSTAELKQAAEAGLLATKKSVLLGLKEQTDKRREELLILGTKIAERRHQLLELWEQRDVLECFEAGEALKPTPSAFLMRLEGLQKKQETREVAALGLVTQAQGHERELQGHVSSLEKQRDDLEGELRKEAPKLLLELSRLGLVSEEEARARRLAPHDLLAGRERADRLQRRGEQHKIREEERRLALATHEEKRPASLKSSSEEEEGVADERGAEEGTSFEEGLLASFKRAEEAEREASAHKEEQQIVLADVKRRRSEFAQAGEQMRVAQQEAKPWLRLAELIGKRDGNAFREFAQGLNLHRLIAKANLHLQRLSERYQLTQAKKEGLPTLDFAIQDLWQVGGARSPRSLSGGERFLVSLALALGLSDLRSQSLPIETLLLDEGFGTLDPETLDVALAALQHLQADGRQVGVISHVAGLKERIAAQVRIAEEGAGRSRIVVARGGI